GQQILANVAEDDPLSKQGSLLRAIAHNRLKPAFWVVTQPDHRLVPRLEYYAQKTFPDAERDNGADASCRAAGTKSCRPSSYQDWRGEFTKRIETAFPAGSSGLCCPARGQRGHAAAPAALSAGTPASAHYPERE
ncbi:MAG: hypothetical protein U5O16_23680, partial [Rhodococcus sp. (in: high G+C Gram-positive bacteria)]|uniref:hypothetical protein n=1 Tax=Rhodococcus sp. TaxID=1831 RepID=UPI002ADCE7BA|nr:hypothetical protein [Rhodococcus sp. (in: high G+C Gram-positive bacteria)]